MIRANVFALATMFVANAAWAGMWDTACEPTALTKEFGDGYVFKSTPRSGVHRLFYEGDRGRSFLELVGDTSCSNQDITSLFQKKLAGLSTTGGLVDGGSQFEPSVICKAGKAVAFRLWFNGDVAAMNGGLEKKYGKPKKETLNLEGLKFKLWDNSAQSVVISEEPRRKVIYYFAPSFFKEAASICSGDAKAQEEERAKANQKASGQIR